MYTMEGITLGIGIGMWVAIMLIAVAYKGVKNVWWE